MKYTGNIKIKDQWKMAPQIAISFDVSPQTDIASYIDSQLPLIETLDPLLTGSFLPGLEGGQTGVRMW